MMGFVDQPKRKKGCNRKYQNITLLKRVVASKTVVREVVNKGANDDVRK